MLKKFMFFSDPSRLYYETVSTTGIRNNIQSIAIRLYSPNVRAGSKEQQHPHISGFPMTFYAP